MTGQMGHGTRGQLSALSLECLVEICKQRLYNNHLCTEKSYNNWEHFNGQNGHWSFSCGSVTGEFENRIVLAESSAIARFYCAVFGSKNSLMQVEERLRHETEPISQ